MDFQTIPEIGIDLDAHGADRWAPLAPYREIAQGMVHFALKDAGVGTETGNLISKLLKDASLACVEEDLRGLSEVLRIPHETLLAANLYYDSLKLLWACSAFAVDTPQGPLHARNLDWVAEDLKMSEASLTLRYRGTGFEFVSVGWPGMVGVLSASAPGRFSISLNAVCSEEPFSGGLPVVFLLRRVLEEAKDFEAAVAILETEKICSDCILLVTGTEAGQFVIVERSPSRAAVIRPTDGVLIATNHYQELEAPDEQLIKPDDERERTTIDRHCRLDERLAGERPATFKQCLSLLRDPNIFMDITVQQMVFQPATGDYCAEMIRGR